MRGRVRPEGLAAAVERIAAAGTYDRADNQADNRADNRADDRALRAQLLQVVQRFVPFDSYAFVLTDPVTTVGSSPLAEIPDLTTLPDLVRLKYLTPVNRWTGLPPSGCTTLQRATSGRLGQSLVWREYLAGCGVVDVLSAVFTDRFGTWGFLDLWRRDAAFGAADVAAVARARPAITARLRAAQAAGFLAAPATPSIPSIQTRPAHTVAPDVRGPGALLLSPTLRVRAQTPQTQAWLAALLPPDAGASPVPASALNVAGQLLANEAGVDDHPAQTRVQLLPGTWLTLRADRVAGEAPTPERDIAVAMEVSSAAERRDLLSRTHGLTRREDELLRLLAEGVDTRAAADLMSISGHTVQDHLKAVFSKTSTSSRREVLAKALGG